MNKNRDKDNDNFNEIIKNKLQNYSLPVEDNSWKEIEKRLENAKPEKKIALWPWIAGISVAASIAFIWLIVPFNKQIIDHDTTAQLPHHEETITESVSTEEIVSLSHLPSVQNQPVPVRESHQTGTPEQLTLPEPDVIAQEPEKDLPIIAENSKPEKKNPEKLKELADYWQEEEKSVNLRKKKTTSLGLHIGSGGGFYASNDLQSIPNNFNTGFKGSRMALNAPAPLRSEILNPDDFTQIIHRPPVSFGLSIRKELTDYLFVESGLNYTYLYSEFENKMPRQDAKLELHYMGIPVNVVAYLYPNKYEKWNIYASAGGMVEKGLLSHYVQNTYENNVAVKTKSDERIDGLQWSLQAAVGVDYKLNKDYSIYLEPKVNYYLDNNQPFNARTEHPLVLGINAGLRFTW